MEIVIQLEQKFEKLINKIKELKEENSLLKQQLEQERGNRDELRSRIENLLNKVQEAMD